MPTSTGRTPTTTTRNGGALDQAGGSFLSDEGGAGRSSERGGAAAGPVKEVDCQGRLELPVAPKMVQLTAQMSFEYSDGPVR